MNKNVLITGGSRGIGLGIAKELGKMGYNLILNGMRAPELVTPVIEELSGSGSEVIYCQGDISDAEDRDNIVNTATNQFGQIHVLVNNAGVSPEKRSDLLDTSEESFDRVLHTNLKGPFFLTQKVAHHMIQHRLSDPDYRGCIVNITSVSAVMASTNRGEYCISKAGLAMMTKLFAARLGEYNIPVFEIRPGIIETDMTADVLIKYQKMADEGLMVQSRLGIPEDVGKVVKALVEGNFQYSTGQVINVDGGMTVSRL